MSNFAAARVLHRLIAACMLFYFTLMASCSSPPEHFLKPTSGIRGIFEDHEGNFWFSSPDWMAKYDPSMRTSTESGFSYFTQNLPGILLGAYQQDSQGRMWLQNEEGIHRFDGKEFRLIENRDYHSRDQWAKADGDMWFGLDRGLGFTDEEGEWGVYRVHDGVCTFLAFPEPPPEERQMFYPLTSDVMYGKDGTVWFGTFTAAFGFNGETFDIVGREKMGRSNDPAWIGIRGYHMDRRGFLWMADNGKGVFVYDGKEVRHFTALHKLREQDVDGNSLHRSLLLTRLAS